jgi:hypothetical protein
MQLFTFMHGDLSTDNQCSATCSVHADDLEDAKSKLRALVDELQLDGAPEGVIELHAKCRPTLTLHVCISPEAIANDDNWEDDGDDGIEEGE